jgi:tetratricopeptide (TPR) repeat protein
MEKQTEQLVGQEQRETPSVFPLPPIKGIERVQQWALRHRRLLLGIGVGVLVLVGGLFYWHLAQQKRAEEAALWLSRVYTYYDNGDYERALFGDTTKTIRGEPVRGLLAIVEDYAGTPSGKVAAFYAGSAYLLLGQIAKAEPYFKLAATSEAPLIQVGAYAGLAACREEEGKLAEAAQLYERAALVGTPIGMAERYRFFAAYCYELAGNAQKAAQLYRQILTENEFSDFANEAKAGLARLGIVVE